MTYRDENGLIMIDEVAANSDISKLTDAKCKLENALNSIATIVSLNSELAGPTATAISDTSLVLKKHLETQISNIDICISNIKGTVKKYQTIDAELGNSFTST